MITLLDCIHRIPSVIERILSGQEEAFRDFDCYLSGKAEQLREIVLIGSGTSNTVSVTARPFMEKAAGLIVRAVYPNEAASPDAVLGRDALYVFVSQTGTSKVVRQVMDRLMELGYWTAALTESGETPIAKASACHVLMNLGPEEYLMRTIGYTGSVLDLMLLAMHVGRARGYLSEKAFHEYLHEAARVPAYHKDVTKRAEEWVRAHEEKFWGSRCVIFTGAGALSGVAQEASVKFWEVPYIAAFGYELEEGLHGPNYGYGSEHLVIVLCDGRHEKEKALALTRYTKETFGSGYIAGPVTVSGDDLLVELPGNDFDCLALSGAVQTMAYFLAEDKGIDTTLPHDHTVMDSYFKTHW
ncbi:MAG: SIS domain-containing protein [Lachnospiraceae bacterium]|nr:SIS domain-containing protein [Lachnospiraceae bacterium]